MRRGQIAPELTIVARARDADHARALYGLGVTDAVPETMEASLQLSEAVLVDIGVPMVWSSPRSTNSGTSSASSSATAGAPDAVLDTRPATGVNGEGSVVN